MKKNSSNGLTVTLQFDRLLLIEAKKKLFENLNSLL